jgi:carboxypeptidase PM20D1
MQQFKTLGVLHIGSVVTLSMSVLAYAADDNDFPSLQMKGVEPVAIKVDIDAAAQRLSKGVQFPTISNQDRNDFDTKAFSDYHRFLVEAYPNVHKKLKREVLGDPRPYSLLYIWEGKDPSLPPALFYAHMDVVPVPGDSRWLYLGAGCPGR